MEGGRQLAWRSAVVAVPAKGRVRVGRDSSAPVAPGGSSHQPADHASADPRERAIEAMAAWCHGGDRPLWLVEGAAGAGKTTLIAEVADRIATEKWPCGWARPGLGADAVAAAARTGRPALLLVDDAETRADVFDLLTILANGGHPVPVRVIVAARDFGGWWSDLFSRLTPAEQEVLSSGRTVMGGGAVAAASPKDLVLRDVNGADTHAHAVLTLATADPASPAVLLRLAALVVALSTRVGQLRPAELRAAMRDLFEEEDGFWWRTAKDVSPTGQPEPALRTALTCAAVLGSDGLADAGTVLRRVPTLAAGAAGRLARLAVWWQGLYSRTPEFAAATPRLPSWLADRLPDGTDSTGVSWTVAALTAERRTTATLAQLAINAHRDVWPSRSPMARDRPRIYESMRRFVAAAAPVDEALAWLTQELELGENELEALGDAISYPTRSLSRTAIVLARRLLDNADTDEEQGPLALSLGARYSEMGRWDLARKLTGRAVEVFHALAETDRGRYLPDLAAAVSNLGSCHAQLGQHDEATSVMYEAVALHRELIETDRNRHLAALARSLTNLSACLSRSGRRPAALGAAGQAVGIFRELMEINPQAYAGELAAADHNWRICRQALGEPVVGHPPA